MLGLGLEPKGIGTSANSAGFEGRWVRPAAGATKIWTFFHEIVYFCAFLQRAQCSHCKRCISYSNSVRLSVRPSVRPSVRHTPVLCQNDGT